jgi:TonB-dependent receptor
MTMRYRSIARSPIAQAVALAIGGAILSTVQAQTSPAQAQTTAGDQTAAGDQLEEVVVTGLRQSLQSAEGIKRDSSGIVDAITNEDIGKFPDTNLAEAIQRIPGVTIDRVNNEGSRVTVRGFGPEYNLVTLNGRSMPGGVNAGTQSATRSFDFANLSADAIAGINVYKTGRADVPSGGIGSTIDIRTARPFDYKELRATFQAKAIDDTSSRVGSKVTPEVSGLLSDTFLDDRLGFLVNGSYSKRDSRLQFADVGGWINNQIPASRLIGTNLNPGGNNWEPQSEDWGFYDYQRTRTNGQAVLQFKPVDSLVATVDYTYAQFKDSQQRHSMGAWFGAYANSGDLIGNATVNSHGTVTDFVATGNDLSYFASANEFRNRNGSTGLNVKWDALDNIGVTLDAHHSTADSGGGPGGNNAFFIVGQNPAIATTKTFSIGGLEIPTTTWAFKSPYTLGTLDTSTISPLFAQDNSKTFETTIDEVRLDLVWKNSSEGSSLKSIKFGVEDKNMKTKALAFNTFYGTGFYDPANNGLIPASAYMRVSSCSILKSFSGGGCGIGVPYFFTYSVASGVAATAQKYNYTYALGSPTNDDRIKEQTPSGFLQLDFDTDFNGMRFKALAGVRYEKTTVTANSLQNIPTAVSWDNPTEFHTLFAPGQSYTSVGSKYDEFLPSLDMSLQVRPDALLRASYSKTITRSDLTQMVGTEVVSSTPKPGARTVTAGNPALLPYESNNFDVSAEWYYSKDSYFAANWFTKHVTNFLTLTTTKGSAFGLTDPLVGTYAQTAIAQLKAGGNAAPSDAQIFAQMLVDNPGKTSFTGQPGDPLVIWDITAPSNASTTEIHGFEFAVQHVFGDSGFGVQANVSLPAGGAQFNNEVIGSQFALPGLSKSYNLVGFYEKYGFQTRLAYTHRSSFLSATSQDQAGNEPQNVAAYGQLDASASYDINKHFSLFVDGINLTSAKQRVYGRYSEQLLYAYEGYARYQFGFRAKL